MKTIVLIALEASGDLLGAKIIEAFHRQGYTNLSGVAGPRMREAGLHVLKKMEEFQAIGPVEVIKKLPKILELVRFLEKQFIDNPPDLIVFLDSPSFSLKFAKRLKKKKIRSHTVQVVAPSVWAWGKEKRQKQVKESIDLLFPLFAFEQTLFPVETIWCGHPLFTKEFSTPKAAKSSTPLLALFPGSRPSEVRKNLKLMLLSACKAQALIPTLDVAISVSDTIPDRLKQWIKSECQCSGIQNVTLVEGNLRYELMERAWAALAKCGTVTLELFLKQVPTIVCYKINFLEYLWVKYVLKVETNFFALPNILSGKEAVKEYIKDEPTPTQLASYLVPLLQDKPKSVDPTALELVHKQLFALNNSEDEMVQHIRTRFL